MVITTEQVPLIEKQIQANPFPGYEYLQMLSGSFNGIQSYYFNFRQFLFPFGLNQVADSGIVLLNDADNDKLLMMEHDTLDSVMTTFDCLRTIKDSNGEGFSIDEFKSIMAKATFNQNYRISARNGRLMIHVNKNLDSVIGGINQLLSLRTVACSTIAK